MISTARQRGFTLLEVLVAFIIAAIAIAALLQGAGGGLDNARVATHYEEALGRAQSRMALLSANLQPGDQQGDDGGGYLWRTSVQPIRSITRLDPPPPAPAGQPAGQPRPEQTVLYALTVTIAWDMDGSRHQVTLASQRLGIVAAPPA